MEQKIIRFRSVFNFRHLFFGVIIIVMMGTCMPEVIAQAKPNIIIFLSDDQNQQDIGAYGNREVKTPNMDQLAAEGMRFTRAYAASPMCTPSRSAMFTDHPFRTKR